MSINSRVKKLENKIMVSNKIRYNEEKMRIIRERVLKMMDEELDNTILDALIADDGIQNMSLINLDEKLKMLLAE